MRVRDGVMGPERREKMPDPGVVAALREKMPMFHLLLTFNAGEGSAESLPCFISDAE
jgi:hypothetical protein